MLRVPTNSGRYVVFSQPNTSPPTNSPDSSSRSTSLTSIANRSSVPMPTEQPARQTSRMQPTGTVNSTQATSPIETSSPSSTPKSNRVDSSPPFFGFGIAPLNGAMGGYPKSSPVVCDGTACKGPHALCAASGVWYLLCGRVASFSSSDRHVGAQVPSPLGVSLNGTAVEDVHDLLLFDVT